MSIFSDLRTRLTNRERDSEQVYRDLISQLANDRPVSLDRVEAALQQSGHSMCELETSVNTIKRRRQLVRDLEKLSNPIDTLQAIGADRRKAEEAFDTAKHRFDETMAALQVRERQYRSSLQMAEGIRRELDNLTPELTGEARTSRREANQLTAKATEIDRQAEEILHGRLVRAKCGLAESHNPEDRKHYETEKLAAERAIADLKVQARELRQRATELSRRAEEIKASCYAE